MENLNEILEFKLIDISGYTLTINHIVILILVFLGTKTFLWLVKKTMRKSIKFKKMGAGNEYAIFQIIRYVIWVMAIAFGLESIGVKITILLAGSAALLVGLGMGLQQTFNDFVSGLILLIEGTIRVKDIIEVDGAVVQVQSIGLRTSVVENRDDIKIILPNSKIVNDKVINWSHNSTVTRFKVSVGVAYGSDVNLVLKLLKESAKEHPDCIAEKEPVARFTNFGESSLDFDILFWSSNMFRIENTMSDIRIKINKKFKENGVQIPFPQRDLHIKSSQVTFK